MRDRIDRIDRKVRARRECQRIQKEGGNEDVRARGGERTRLLVFTGKMEKGYKRRQNRQRSKRIQDVASRRSTDRYRDLSSGVSAVDAWKSGLFSACVEMESISHNGG